MRSLRSLLSPGNGLVAMDRLLPKRHSRSRRRIEAPQVSEVMEARVLLSAAAVMSQLTSSCAPESQPAQESSVSPGAVTADSADQKAHSEVLAADGPLPLPAASSAQVINVSTAAELQSALNGATGGETIVLADGNYGGLTISGKNYASYVILQSENALGAKFTGITFSNSSYVRFDGIWTERPVSQPPSNLISVNGSHHFEYFNGKISSVRTYDTSHAVLFDAASRDSSIHNTEITRVRSGIGMLGGSNFSFTNIHLHHFTESGFRTGLGGTTDGVLIQNSHIHDHQIFSSEPNVPVNPHGSVFALRRSKNVDILDNHWHDSRLGWIQFYAGEGGNVYHYENVRVQGNLVYDVHGTAFIHSPGGDKTFAGYFIYNQNTFVNGWWNEGWTTSDSSQSRMLAQGPSTSTQVIRFPAVTEAKNNLIIGILDAQPSPNVHHNVFYWSFFGYDSSNHSITQDGPTSSDKTYIDDDLVESPHYVDSPHGLIHTVGGALDLRPKIGSVAATASDTGGHVGAIPPGTPLPSVETPTITPGGGTFLDSVDVTLASGTPGAALYYTLDGSTPTESSTLYTGPFTLTEDTTVKVRAYLDGLNPSLIATAFFDHDVPTVNAPTITPGGAVSSDPVDVTLATSTPGAALYYTLDGSTPTESSTLYTGPFTLTDSATVTARGFLNGFDPSPIASEDFQVGSFTGSNSEWLNIPFQSQDSVFTFEFDWVPHANNMDGVVGLSAHDATWYTDLATTVRLNSAGFIDARDGSTYRSDASLAYSAGTTYHVSMPVDVANKTYSVIVTPAGGSPIAIATDFAFRTQQAGVGSLSETSLFADLGSHTVSNIDLVGATAPDTLSVTVSPTSISENGGGATGTVTRNSADLTSPLVVTLTSNDTSEATVPASVTIPAGNASATFAVTGVDDALVDGTQSVVISAGAAGFSGGANTLDVTDDELSSERVSEDLLVLYEFDEGNGSTVTDTSGVGSPLNLTIANTANVTWANEVLTIDAATLISSGGPASKISTAVAASNALTLEAWIIPANTTQNGPARIVTLSADGYERNVTLGQGVHNSTGDRYETRLRTTTTGNNGTNPALQSAAGTLSAQLQHVVYTRDAAGNAKLYIDSVEVVSATVSGDLSNWDSSFDFALANELTNDRAWLGTFDLVAVYDDALTPTEVAQNYLAGPVIQDQTPTLSVSITPGSISENGGTATGTVTRNTADLSTPLLVTLTSDDASEATVPATVTIPAGNDSVTFAITGVDDALADGTKTVAVSAAAAGFDGGSDTLDVTDDETPALSVSITPGSISENGGAATGTVTRNTEDLSTPLLVTLTSDDASEATVAASVTIPAGNASATFSVTGVDDVFVDGTQTVVVSAAASGFSGGSDALDVTDDDVSVSTDSLFGVLNDGRVYVGVSAGDHFVNAQWGMISNLGSWSDLVVGDFNGDGNEDLAARDASGYWTTWLNQGDSFVAQSWGGRWSPSVSWDTVRVGDFDGNGFADIAGRAQSGSWYAAMSDGTGFSVAALGGWSTMVGWNDVSTGDFNGDGKTDIVGRASTGTWVILQSNASGHANIAAGAWSPTVTWHDVLVGDFNNDGNSDVIGRAESGTWWVGYSNGAGFDMSYVGSWTTNTIWSDVSIGDFNGDGYSDVAGRAASGMWYIYQSGDATTISGFRMHYGIAWSPTVNWQDVQIGDFDGDGLSDIAGRSDSGKWVVAVSQGDGFVNSVWATWNPNAQWEKVGKIRMV